MLTSPRVSVITITFNQQEFVEATLDGLLAQEFDNVEFIVSDDCSTDRTPEILAKYQAANPDRVRLTLRTRNVGAAANFIEAIQSARGDYIAFCDGDDYWTDTQKLQKQVAVLDANPGCTVCFHPVVMFEGPTAGGPDDILHPCDAPVELAYWTSLGQERFACERLLVDNFITTSSVMYRRQDYAELRSDIMPADWYLHLLHAARGDIAFLPDVMAAYRRHAGGLWTSTERDPYLLYLRYGVERVALQDALLDLFAHDPALRAIVLRSLGKAFRDLAAGDATFGEGKALVAAQRYPRATVQSLLANLDRADAMSATADEMWATAHQLREQRTILASRVTALRRKLDKSRATVRSLRAEQPAAGQTGLPLRAQGVDRLTRGLPARLRRRGGR